MDKNSLIVGLNGVLTNMSRKELYRRLAVFYRAFINSTESREKARECAHLIEEAAISINDPTMGIMVLLGFLVGQIEMPEYMASHETDVLDGIKYIVYGDPLYESLLTEEERTLASELASDLFRDDVSGALR